MSNGPAVRAQAGVDRRPRGAQRPRRLRVLLPRAVRRELAPGEPPEPATTESLLVVACVPRSTCCICCTTPTPRRSDRCFGRIGTSRNVRHPTTTGAGGGLAQLAGSAWAEAHGLDEHASSVFANISSFETRKPGSEHHVEVSGTAAAPRVPSTDGASSATSAALGALAQFLDQALDGCNDDSCTQDSSKRFEIGWKAGCRRAMVAGALSTEIYRTFPS